MLSLALAAPVDAPRIAEIHMAAFGANAMLRAQFPAAPVRAALRRSVEVKARADMADPRTTVLVVREDCSGSSSDSHARGAEGGGGGGEKGVVVAFAKWAHPVPSADEDYAEPPWIWPEGTDRGILDAWAGKAEEAQRRAVGSRPCYRLTFMGTDPAHERRGAATMMARWGIEQCKKDRVPAYLESTLEAAPFYAKNGFTSVEKFSLEYRRAGSSGEPETYEEISFVYDPLL
ncbi:putative GNAT family acetyltransferase [Biscogniauxia marginata]|nr:putative GNAT family acetyltransferase [Biscogniauxia marginata]